MIGTFFRNTAMMGGKQALLTIAFGAEGEGPPAGGGYWGGLLHQRRDRRGPSVILLLLVLVAVG